MMYQILYLWCMFELSMNHDWENIFLIYYTCYIHFIPYIPNINTFATEMLLCTKNILLFIYLWHHQKLLYFLRGKVFICLQLMSSFPVDHGITSIEIVVYFHHTNTSATLCLIPKVIKRLLRKSPGERCSRLFLDLLRALGALECFFDSFVDTCLLVLET